MPRPLPRSLVPTRRSPGAQAVRAECTLAGRSVSGDNGGTRVRLSPRRCALMLAARTCSLFVALLALAPAWCGADEPPVVGLEQRTPWTTSRLVGSPEPPLPYTVEKTFTQLELKTPIYVIEEPGTDYLLVVLHPADKLPSRVVRFQNDPEVATFEPFFESPDRLIYSICPDPDYATNRTIYVFTNGPTPQSERQDRVARYRVTDTEPPQIDVASEETIIEWRSAGHDGGDLAFGLDGMLYLTTGDGTGDSDTWNSGQTLDDLLGSVLRIDVHACRRRAALHRSRRQSVRQTSRGPRRNLGLRPAQPLADEHRSPQRPRVGRQQRPGPVGNGPSGAPGRELRLERLRRESSLLPGTQARAHAARATDDRTFARRVPLAHRRRGLLRRQAARSRRRLHLRRLFQRPHLGHEARRRQARSGIANWPTRR